jgi:DNA-binding transcriptional ArsR family regulator
MAEDDDAEAVRRARALSSPLRMRILRFCLHEPRTNREIADEFDLNPGTSLHHVRTLLDTGFLAAEDERVGNRGAREVPYRATRRSWDADVPGISSVLIRTFLDEIEGVEPDDIAMARLGLKLDAEGERELWRQLSDVLLRFKDREPDPTGRPISIMLAVHPERGAPPRQSGSA